MGRRVIASTMIAFFIGCGGGGGGSLAFDQLDDEAARIYCNKIFTCCTDAERMAELGFFTPMPTTEAECVQTLLPFYALVLGPTQTSIDEGTVVYHGDRAGACLDAADSASCAEFAAMGDLGADGGDCAAIFEGTIAIGMPCDTDDECASQYCEGDSTQPPTPGTCAAKPGVGQPCPDSECADGAFCDFGAMGSACAAKLADGMPCDYEGECASGGCIGADPMMGTPGTCGTNMTCDGV